LTPMVGFKVVSFKTGTGVAQSKTRKKPTKHCHLMRLARVNLLNKVLLSARRGRYFRVFYTL